MKNILDTLHCGFVSQSPSVCINLGITLHSFGQAELHGAGVISQVEPADYYSAGKARPWSASAPMMPRELLLYCKVLAHHRLINLGKAFTQPPFKMLVSAVGILSRWL